jgi:hypothetical protein
MKTFAWIELIVAFVILPVLCVARLCKKGEPKPFEGKEKE